MQQPLGAAAQGEAVFQAALTDALQGGQRPVVAGDDVALPQVEAHLLGGHLAEGLVGAQGVEDDEDVVVVLVQLGRVGLGRQGVLDRQGVEAKDVRQHLLRLVGVGGRVQVHPEAEAVGQGLPEGVEALQGPGRPIIARD